MDRIKRLNVINAITGIKPANLIGTQDSQGRTNLAIFSSLVHLGSNPALLGFITRPSADVPRHTLQNIEATGHYTINHVPTSLTQQAHQTSAKYKRHQSEFDCCGFTAEYVHDFPAPFVAESVIKIAMQLEQTIPIKLNQTQLVIGSIKHIHIPKELINDEGHIDLQAAASTGLSGLNNYYELNQLKVYPYARPE